MPQTVTMLPRAQAAAKKLPVAESKLLGEFIRQIVELGANPANAASTAKLHARAVEATDKDVAFGGTVELSFGKHRAFYKLTGTALVVTNLVSSEAH